MLEIKLKPNQLRLFNNWLINQKYLTIDEVETFKNSLIKDCIKLKESDFDMVYECCPFGFIIERIDEYDLKNK